jgi:hypothetical protein
MSVRPPSDTPEHTQRCVYTTEMSSGADEGGDLIQGLLGAVAAVSSERVPDEPAALRNQLQQLRRASDLLEVHFSRLAAAFAATPEQEWQGCVSPIQWLRSECGMTGSAAWKAVCVGEQAAVLPESLDAVAAGDVGFSHLALLAGTAQALRESSTSTPFDEQPLLTQALAHPLARFRDDCAQVRHAADAAAFLAEQSKDAEYRSLDVRTGEDRTGFLNGWFDAVGWATIRTALDALARRSGTDDVRSRDRRYADALVELAEHSLNLGLVPSVGGQRPHLHVTTTLETLAGTPGAPAGVLEGAGPIAGATVQRIACDANITRVVLGPDSAILDMGRNHRLPGLKTRRALRVRDGGCAWPGCDRTVSWTAAHHLVHWAQGGATELSNLVLLCHHHHRRVHEGGWQLARGEDGQMLAIAPVASVPAHARAPDPMPLE